MTILLWSVLNIVVLLGLLYLFFRVAQLLRKHVGWVAALLFSLGPLTISCSKSGSPTNSISTANLLGEMPKGTPLGNASSLTTIPLGFNKVNLLAEYYNEQGNIRPRGLYATIAGFTLGHRWQPLAGSLAPQNRQLHYTAVLWHEWTLLGYSLFNSTEGYEGLMPLGSHL